MSGINGRMINKNNYSPQTLATCSLVSAYFINIFYNELFEQGRKFYKSKQAPSITDGYIACLDIYTRKICTEQEFYIEAIRGIWKLYVMKGYTGLTLNKLIDRIVCEFIPNDYAQVADTAEKDNFLHTIILNVIKAMVRKINRDHINAIIDCRETENVNILHDICVDLLLLEREKLYRHFLNQKTGQNTPLVDVMRKEIEILYNEKLKLNKQIIELKKKMIELKKKYLQLHQQNLELNEKNADLQSIIDESKAYNEILPSRSQEERIQVDSNVAHKDKDHYKDDTHENIHYKDDVHYKDNAHNDDVHYKDNAKDDTHENSYEESTHEKQYEDNASQSSAHEDNTMSYFDNLDESNEEYHNQSSTPQLELTLDDLLLE